MWSGKALGLRLLMEIQDQSWRLLSDRWCLHALNSGVPPRVEECDGRRGGRAFGGWGDGMRGFSKSVIMNGRYELDRKAWGTPAPASNCSSWFSQQESCRCSQRHVLLPDSHLTASASPLFLVPHVSSSLSSIHITTHMSHTPYTLSHTYHIHMHTHYTLMNTSCICALYTPHTHTKCKRLYCKILITFIR